MTAGPETVWDDPPGVIRDVENEPIYMHAVPVVGGGRGQVCPGVEICINAYQSIFPAAQMWTVGLSMLRAAGAAKFGSRRSGQRITVALSIDPAQVYELDPNRADSVGAMMIGASISSVHDATIWRHLTEKIGMDDEKAAELLEGIETVPIIQFLESAKDAI